MTNVHTLYPLLGGLLCAAVSGRLLATALHVRDGLSAGLATTAFGMWLALVACFVWRLL